MIDRKIGDKPINFEVTIGWLLFGEGDFEACLAGNAGYEAEKDFFPIFHTNRCQSMQGSQCKEKVMATLPAQATQVPR